jgi:ribonuclease VapC
MVIDTSAIFAAIAGESDSATYRAAIKTASIRLMSGVTLLETRIVLFSRIGSGAIVTLYELMKRAEIIEIPFDEQQSEVAFDAFKRYGKGRGHPAQLNIIDCAAYALARSRDLPLLFKGKDFAQTDVTPALASNAADERPS